MNLFDLYAKITLDDSDYNDGVDKAKNLSKSFGNTWKSVSAGTVAAGHLIADAVKVAGNAVKSLAKTALDYNSEIEGYTTNFTVMLGDAEKAAQKVNELKEMGAKTPFEMGDLASATQTLLAFNVSADDSTGVLQKLGDISLGNVQKLESLTRAYGKMNSSQKVTLEDINMMIDAGFNPLLLVAENTGESMKKLYDRISKGKVSFKEIQKAIEQATSEGGQFYQGMEKASETLEGKISTLKDNATALIGQVFIPISEGLTNKILPAAIDAVDKLSQAYEERGIEGMIEAAGEIVGAAVGELATNAPKLITSGVDFVQKLAEGIKANEAAITSGAGETFFAFVNGVITLIPTLLGVALGLVQGFGQYIIDNPDKVIEAAGDLFANLMMGLVTAIPQLLTTAIDIVGALSDYLYENAGKVASGAMEIGVRIVNAIADGIASVWDNLVKNFSGLMSGLTAGISFQTTGTIPGHAGGLDYVPYNGYYAELHRGEMVLNSSEAEAYRRGSFGSKVVQVIQHIYSEAKTAADLMQEAVYEQEKVVLLGV